MAPTQPTPQFIPPRGLSTLMLWLDDGHVGVSFHYANNCRFTRNYVRLTDPVINTTWVRLGGNSNGNRIDHNEFGPHMTAGKQVYVQPAGNKNIPGVTPPSNRQSWALGGSPYNPNLARNTLIDRNWFRQKVSGTSETVILGCCGVTADYQDMRSTLEWNLFEECDGDAEFISVKSSSNTIRFNTIRNSSGMISLRAGNGSTVNGNIILQGAQGGTGGIKVYERNHRIFGNYVDNTGDYPFLLGSGNAYSNPSYSHGQPVNVSITGNTWINVNARPLIFGHGGRELQPSGCTFSGNAIRGTVSPLLSKPKPGDTVFSNNTESGSNPGLPHSPLTPSNVGPDAP